MMIRVPATGPRGFSGCTRGISSRLLGLGDDDGTTDTGSYTSTIDSTSLPILGLSPTDTSILDLPAITPPINVPANAPYGYDELGNPLPSPASVSVGPLMTGGTPTAAQLNAVVTQGTNTGLSPAQISSIINSALSAGLAVFKATSSPSLIPGTNLVYNPATGQVSNATTGLTGSQLASTLGLSPQLLLLLGAGLLAVMFLEGSK